MRRTAVLLLLLAAMGPTFMAQASKPRPAFDLDVRWEEPALSFRPATLVFTVRPAGEAGATNWTLLLPEGVTLHSPATQSTRGTPGGTDRVVWRLTVGFEGPWTAAFTGEGPIIHTTGAIDTVSTVHEAILDWRGALDARLDLSVETIGPNQVRVSSTYEPKGPMARFSVANHSMDHGPSREAPATQATRIEIVRTLDEGPSYGFQSRVDLFVPFRSGTTTFEQPDRDESEPAACRHVILETRFTDGVRVKGPADCSTEIHALPFPPAMGGLLASVIVAIVTRQRSSR